MLMAMPVGNVSMDGVVRVLKIAGVTFVKAHLLNRIINPDSESNPPMREYKTNGDLIS